MLSRLRDLFFTQMISASEDAAPVFSERSAREDFERETSRATGGRLSRQADGTYYDHAVEAMWQGWLSCAKHNHAIVVLQHEEKQISDKAW